VEIVEHKGEELGIGRLGAEDVAGHDKAALIVLAFENPYPKRSLEKHEKGNTHTSSLRAC
jgi:hypothetical protein